ncbi:3-keto-disaccharide hydrolase [Tautonia sociabilis]|uniref:DUF1080 domain-containing protein n=1 Tax=Tautonia sociabilis TaxID=2080755 RepID=A0A432MMN0_9BACT|nr:DUF1080 domain-containing protein [Tautonia sociabilis]RUL88701.1 DUF1080 domain-containing protein [Tautonia sociabilis]
MRPNRSDALTLALSLVLLPAPAALARGDDAPGAIPLFDGQTLANWTPTDFYKAGEVVVEDGAILLKKSEASGGMTGITTSREDLPRIDYELSYRAKRTEGRDFFAAATFPVGETYLTFVNGGWGGSVTGLSSIDGADASENLTGTYHKFENDTWYSFRIRVTDAAIRCWVDDEELVSFDPTGHHLGTRLETRVSQPLGFATWQSGGALKDIVLRPLSPEEVASEAEAADTP